MTSQVLDLTTIAHALTELGETFLHNPEWHGFSLDQTEFLAWYLAHREQIRKLDGLEAAAATEAEPLNAFLTRRGFEPMFDPFDGIGVVAVLDMLVNWALQATVSTLTRQELGEERNTFGQRRSTWVSYPAFQLPPTGVEIHDVAGFADPLLQLHTQTGHSLWLMKSPAPESGLQLVQLAQRILTRCERRISRHYQLGVIVPMVDLDLKADLSWLLGMESVGKAGHYYVEQAFQQFKLRMNEHGARVKVATGMVIASAACGPIEEPYILNDPFLGFFTQPGHDNLPLAAFYADTDVWRQPSGSLEEL